jgi:hypothetical protein
MAFARPWFFVRDSRVEQSHQIRTVRVVTVGRGQQAGGLVEREQVFILEQNRDFPKLAGGGRGEFDGRAHLLGQLKGKGGNWQRGECRVFLISPF